MKENLTFKELIKGELPVLVDFWSEWCSPCVAMMPIIDELATEFAGTAKVVKVNVSEHESIATELEIRGLPLVALYQNGEEKWRRAGWQRIERLRDVIERAIKNEL